MTRPINALKDRSEHILTLRVVVFLLFSFLIYFYVDGRTKPSDITVHFAPDVGAAVKQGEISPAYVYAFANNLVTDINDWPDGGVVDYKRKIDTYACYTTDKYRSWLLKTLVQRTSSMRDISQIDELDRIRSVSAIEPYNPEKVRDIGNGVWYVWLDLRIKEKVLVKSGITDQEMNVKDVAIRYPIRVVWDGRECNPAKLSVDGFFDNPIRIGGVK